MALLMNVRRATETNIPRMVAISEAKRIEYEGYSPIFWRKAPDSSPKQELFLQRLLTGTDIIARVAETEASLLGFVILKGFGDVDTIHTIPRVQSAGATSANAMQAATRNLGAPRANCANCVYVTNSTVTNSTRGVLAPVMRAAEASRRMLA